MAFEKVFQLVDKTAKKIKEVVVGDRVIPLHNRIAHIKDAGLAREIDETHDDIGVIPYDGYNENRLHSYVFSLNRLPKDWKDKIDWSNNGTNS